MKRLVLIVATLCTFSSCGVATKQVYYSHPYIEGNKLDGYSFAVEKHRIKVKATNVFFTEKVNPNKRVISSPYYWVKKKGGSQPRNRNLFFVEFLIVPQAFGGAITPEGFKLVMDEKELSGVVYGPTESLGPKYGGLCDFRVVTDENGKRLWMGHPDEYRPVESLKMTAPLSLQPDKSYCFAIKFNTSPPMPENDFSLFLNGIQLGEKVKRIEFKSAHYEWIHN